MRCPQVATQREISITSADQEREKTKSEHQVVQRRPEILPQGCIGSRVVRRKQKSQHVYETERAGESDANARDEGHPYRELSICGEKSDRCAMRQHDALEYRDHKRISSTVLEEAIDPSLETTTQREFRPKYFVLSKNQKQAARRDSQ